MIGSCAANGPHRSGLESYLYRLDPQLARYTIETSRAKVPSKGSSLFQLF